MGNEVELVCVFFFQLREGAAGLDIGLGERIQLLKDFVATVIKLIYAFLWQVKN